MGVKAPGTANRMAFLLAVRSEMEKVWTSLEESKYERVASGSLSPAEMMAEILGAVEKLMGLGWR